jgi:ABC-type sugar transport system substrate-binding protein
MIEGGFDALVVNPLDETNVVPEILRAADQGVGVFDDGTKGNCPSAA